MPAAPVALNQQVANRLYAQSFSQLEALAQVIHDAMLAAAATFTAPPITLVAYQTDITALTTALAAWGVPPNIGSHADYVALLAARNQVRIDTNSLAGYVTGVAQSNFPSDPVNQRAIILLAGMRPKDPSNFIGPFNKPEDLRQIIGKKGLSSGQAYLRWVKPNMGAIVAKPNGYELWQCDTINGTYIYITSVDHTFYTFTGIAARINYFKVRAIGTAGAGTFSDPCQALTTP